MGTGEFGTDSVRANIEPERGNIIAGSDRATGPNQWLGIGITDNRRWVEGVVIKALAANTGTIHVTGVGEGQSGFQMAAGESVSISIDDLTKVAVFAGTTSDGFTWIAITHRGHTMGE